MVDWAGLISWAIVFHLFGVIIWIGNLLVIATMLSLASEEVGAARERLIVVSRRLFQIGCNRGAVALVFLGATLTPLPPGRSRGGLAASQAGAGPRAVLLPLPPLPTHPESRERSVGGLGARVQDDSRNRQRTAARDPRARGAETILACGDAGLRAGACGQCEKIREMDHADA